MSYDINFWKLQHPLDLTPEQIYGRLCKREPVEGLAKLPVDQILERLKQAYPDFDPTESFPMARTCEGSIEFGWSDQHFRFDIRGICGDCQKAVDIMTEFGCPMYDPQLNKRHDADNGMTLVKPEKFEDATPEQKAEMERLKAEFLAKVEGQYAKKGCGAKVAVFAVAIGVAVVTAALM